MRESETLLNMDGRSPLLLLTSGKLLKKKAVAFNHVLQPKPFIHCVRHVLAKARRTRTNVQDQDYDNDSLMNHSIHNEDAEDLREGPQWLSQSKHIIHKDSCLELLGSRKWSFLYPCTRTLSSASPSNSDYRWTQDCRWTCPSSQAKLLLQI